MFLNLEYQLVLGEGLLPKKFRPISFSFVDNSTIFFTQPNGVGLSLGVDFPSVHLFGNLFCLSLLPKWWLI